MDFKDSITRKKGCNFKFGCINWYGWVYYRFWIWYSSLSESAQCYTRRSTAQKVRNVEWVYHICLSLIVFSKRFRRYSCWAFRDTSIGAFQVLEERWSGSSVSTKDSCGRHSRAPWIQWGYMNPRVAEVMYQLKTIRDKAGTVIIICIR